ncbi:MAG: hypothetical protein QOJ73_3895 [Streptosporangiaceae bacterium]|jgi:hypothetical protein|nr:hypothetical protein [Streptosporangiaceae bacterium]
MSRPGKIARLPGSAAGRQVGGPPNGDPHVPGASGWRPPRRGSAGQRSSPRWRGHPGGAPPGRPGPGPGPTSRPGQGPLRSPTTAGRSTPPRLVASRTSRPLGATRRPGPVHAVCARQRPRGSRRQHVRLPEPVHQPGPGWPRSPGRLTSPDLLISQPASEARPLPMPARPCQPGQVQLGQVHLPPCRPAPRRPVPGQAPLRPPPRLLRTSRPRAPCRPVPRRPASCHRAASRRPAPEGQARPPAMSGRPAPEGQARHPRASRPAGEGRAGHRAASLRPASQRLRRPRPPRRMKPRPRAPRRPASRRPGRRRHRLGSRRWWLSPAAPGQASRRGRWSA